MSAKNINKQIVLFGIFTLFTELSTDKHKPLSHVLQIIKTRSIFHPGFLNPIYLSFPIPFPLALLLSAELSVLELLVPEAVELEFEVLTSVEAGSTYFNV